MIGEWRRRLKTVKMNITEVYGSTVLNINLAFAIFGLIWSVVAIIGNGLIITSFLIEKKLRKRPHYHIVSLAISDILCCLVVVPITFFNAIGQPAEHWTCLLSIAVAINLLTISVYNKVGMSFSRYWATVRPISYYTNESLFNTKGI